MSFLCLLLAFLNSLKVIERLSVTDEEVEEELLDEEEEDA